MYKRQIYNRGSFTTGFYNSTKGKEMMSYERPNHRGSEALKVVSNDKGRVTFKALKAVSYTHLSLPYLNNT